MSLCPLSLTLFLDWSCPERISSIISGRSSKFGVWILLEMTECRIPFWGHCDIDLYLWPCKSLFLIWSSCIYKEREWNTGQQTSKYFAITCILDPWEESKGQNRFFFENGHITYQIKESDTYNNMQTIIVYSHAPSTPRVRAKCHSSFFFWKLSCCISN